MRKAACLLMLVAGCGSGVEQEAGRLLPNDTLRSACFREGYMISDAEIRGEILFWESQRTTTSTELEAEAAVRVACSDVFSGALALVCHDCNLEVVRQVYR